MAENDVLLNHFTVVQKSIDSLINRAATSDKLLKRTKLITVALIFLFAISSGIIIYQVKGSNKEKVEVCESRNRGREGQQVIWRFLLDGSGTTIGKPSLPVAPTPEQVTAYETQIKNRAKVEEILKEYFSPLEC